MHNPFVPETLEGWSVLHLMYRVDWERLKGVRPGDRQQMAHDVAAALAQATPDPAHGATAYVQMLGHKADLMVIVFRQTFDDLARAEHVIAQSSLGNCLIPATSYVSIVELGMYEMTAKIHRQIGEQGLKLESDGVQRRVRRGDGAAASARDGPAFLEVPKRRHVCFYPMNKRRGETLNWYSEPFERRAEMMLEHGKIGRALRGQGHADHFRARSASTTGSGAWTCLRTTRSCSSS